MSNQLEHYSLLHNTHHTVGHALQIPKRQLHSHSKLHHPIPFFHQTDTTMVEATSKATRKYPDTTFALNLNYSPHIFNLQPVRCS